MTAFGASPWGPMALAFLFGVAFGWVLWGTKADRDEGKKETGDPKEIVVIKAELEAARTLLDETDEQDGAITDQLSTLDETVKRANGRLRMILSAVKRAARG